MFVLIFIGCRDITNTIAPIGTRVVGSVGIVSVGTWVVGSVGRVLGLAGVGGGWRGGGLLWLVMSSPGSVTSQPHLSPPQSKLT